MYVYKEIVRERERLGYWLDDRGSVSGRAVISVIYAVACGTAVGSTFPGALTLRLGQLGVGLAARLRQVPGGSAWSCTSSPRFFMACCLINQWIILYVALFA
jgi:hypothetical protein